MEITIWLKIFQLLIVTLHGVCFNALDRLEGQFSFFPLVGSTAVKIGSFLDNTFTGKYFFPAVLIELVGTEYTMHKDACVLNGIALHYFICSE